jgi:hypothetical protein
LSYSVTKQTKLYRSNKRARETRLAEFGIK